jgi:hypothetical protein
LTGVTFLMFFQPVIFRPIRYNLYFIREYRTVSPGLGVHFLELLPLKMALKGSDSDSFGQKRGPFLYPFCRTVR